MSSTTKVYYEQNEVNGWLHNIIREIVADNWRPDYIVGLSRGGLTPAVMLSHYFNIPMHSLNASLRDSDFGPESNLWMSEDAFGYEDGQSDEFKRKNILIVDDINDSGATFKWIQDDWRSSCMPNDPAWQDIWGANVRTAVLINNDASEFKDVNYVGHTINKQEIDIWCVFPWEHWWR